ncbi:MAG: dipeptidase, partial [Chitinophagaceae bacterium]
MKKLYTLFCPMILLLVASPLFAQIVPPSVMQFHQKCILIDTHNDVLSELTMQGYDISHRLNVRNTDLPRLKQGGVDAQLFSIWCDGSYGKGTAFNYANREIDSLMSIIKRNPDKIALAKNYEEIMQDVHHHKLVALIGVEGGHMIEGRLDYLDSLYKCGMRYMTLTWNNNNGWATSAVDETYHKDSLKHLGLTDFGKTVVRRMNQLGVMVDMAHVGRQTFFDAISTSTKPIIVSHSCVYKICPVTRTLMDDQI